MRKNLSIFILFFLFISTFAQKKDTLSIFENSKNWKREIIQLPIDWAPKLKINGFEELLFTPNWSDPKNDEFWSLIIGWKINTTIPLKLKEVENNFKNYFDGLMKPNHWAKKFPEPKVNLQKENEGFIGTMTFFDGFHTGKVITVNIQGSQIFYKETKKSIITFRVSPKDYKDPIWNTLNDVKLQNENNSIIQLDDSWGKELFPFPISFAQNINYNGVAEVRFPPEGWRDPNHQNFWSYTYAWSIHLSTEITLQKLISDLEKYFDGLNRVGVDKNMEKFKAVAKISEIKKIKNTSFFIGKIKTYDRFATQKPITLNVFIESNYCNNLQKAIVFFKFSPKPFEHNVWNMLGKINLNTPICKQ